MACKADSLPSLRRGFFIACFLGVLARCGLALALIDRYLISPLKLEKQRRKLIKLKERAELCLSREQAQVIIRKAEKAQRKIQRAHIES